MNKNYTMLNVKLYGEDGIRLDRLVEAAGVDKSAFVRECIFSKEKIIVMDGLKYISRSLIEINDKLNAALRDDVISIETIAQMRKDLLCISKTFIDICDKITKFKSPEAEEEN